MSLLLLGGTLVGAVMLFSPIASGLVVELVVSHRVVVATHDLVVLGALHLGHFLERVLPLLERQGLD